LAFLQRIEDILREQNGNNKEFRLCDYFDLIGGTSTGSIIAFMPCHRHECGRNKKMYMELGDKIFGKKYINGGKYLK
jgi:patatin-like phospholipase/acyl hydrolase